MKKHIIAFLLLTCITGINAQDNRLFIKDLDLRVYISLENQHYRIGEDIYLYVEIVNQSSDPVEFDTSPYKLNNTKLFVKNLQTGELLEERYSKIVENNNLKKKRPELFELKKTALYTDEILKFKINLPEYFEFDKFGRYKITIKFDPFPAYTIKHKNFTSNPLYLALKDRLIDEEYKELVKLLNEIEKQKRYTPEGTIEFILNSYIKKDWDSYFSYQNLDIIILQYEQFKYRYLKASNTMKEKIISDFKEWIKNRKEMIIDKYEIIEVNHSYKDKRCVVKCKIKYKEPAIYKTYLYIYKLRQNGIKWIIDDIDVMTYSKEK